ncbi:MAG: hypothetical protein U0271_17040 [Polyangiaceae bacterium]
MVGAAEAEVLALVVEGFGRAEADALAGPECGAEGLVLGAPESAQDPSKSGASAANKRAPLTTENRESSMFDTGHPRWLFCPICFRNLLPVD